MPLFDFLKPKHTQPQQAAPESHATATPASQGAGLSANALLNKIGLGGGDTAQQEHAKLTGEGHPPPTGSGLKSALGDLYDSFAHKAQQVTQSLAPAAAAVGGALGTEVAQRVLGQSAKAPAAAALEHAVAPASKPEQSAPAAPSPAPAPAGKDNFDDAKTQQFSQHGLPVTPKAWAMQDSLDGGKMHGIYDAVQAEVKSGKLPNGAAEQAVVDRYIQLANQTKGSTMMLEVLPTELESSLNAPVDAQGRTIGAGAGVGQFKSGPDVAQTRQIAKAVAASVATQQGLDPNSKEAKAQMFAMLIPYNNGGENIAFHDAVPNDAVENLHSTLGKLDKGVNSIATGYSQGGAGVLEYAHKYGGTDGLDKVVALAPMGGADRHGANGTFSGVMKSDRKDDSGVDVLALMNAADPAQHIYDPLRDDPKARARRDDAVASVPRAIGNTLHNALPGPVAGALDRFGAYLQSPAGLHQAEHLVETGLNKIGQPGLADKVEQAAPLIDLAVKEKPRLGDIGTLAYSMGNFLAHGGLHNSIKEGTGWLGQKLELIAPALGVAGGPLVGSAVERAGAKLESASASLVTEDGNLHGPPGDKQFDKGTLGYPIEKAAPLLQTFMGGSQLDANDPKVRELQTQIASHRGQTYARRGDWTFTRPDGPAPTAAP